MTGEITLRGRVLPVGGLREKILAAHRQGIRKFILPKKNQKDLSEIPDDVLREMGFIWVEEMDQVVAQALLPAAPAQRRRPRAVRRPTPAAAAAAKRSPHLKARPESPGQRSCLYATELGRASAAGFPAALLTSPLAKGEEQRP